MLVYFCPKCVRQNAQPHCDSCGRSLGNPSVRYVWEDSRLALSNTHRLGLMARAIAITVKRRRKPAARPSDPRSGDAP